MSTPPSFSQVVITYRRTHPRATPARWDAYGLALHRMQHGRRPTPAEIHREINGGQCSKSVVAAGVRDALRDFSRGVLS